MGNGTSDIVGELWNPCSVVKDDGVIYHLRTLRQAGDRLGREHGDQESPKRQAPRVGAWPWLRHFELTPFSVTVNQE